MALTAGLTAHAELHWRSLPDLPQALGGQFVGVIDEKLVVAGGTAWDRPPWDNGTKTWVDTIYVLEQNSKTWKLAGTLPHPLAYGASVNVKDGMILFGGQTSSDFEKTVLHLSLRGGKPEIRKLADLPAPMAMMNATLAGGMVYLAGGQPTFQPTRALKTFASISLHDLLAGKQAWKDLPSWDGAGRFFTHVAACGDTVYLAGGADLVAGPAGPPVRQFLRDAHRFSPKQGWEKLPDLPRAAQAGLAACHDGQFYVFGGSDGTLSEELRDKHPGFRLDVLTYDPQTRAWRETGRVPTSLVTTGITRWNGEYVIAGGEDRPGHRSAKVVAARIGASRK